MTDDGVLGLLAGHGIEIEYMIVDRTDLRVRPIADRLIERELGRLDDDVERGHFAWSNELARHVIEIKTNGPVADLAGLAQGFQAEIAHIDDLLGREGARLMPGGMHPLMDPHRELEIWPHGNREIYDTFHRVFDCRGHGWANLQSAHLNLSFGDDDEFGRLHAAIRALLPLMPSLAAASPFVDGRASGFLDARLDVYARNAHRVPSVSGVVVPEPVFTRRDYEALLEGIYADLAPLDPEGVLRHEWVNARGCIARFDRMAIEIRVLDTQECPRADVAIAAAIAATLRALCDGSAERQGALRALETADLARTLWRCVESGDQAAIDDGSLLRALDLPAEPTPAADVWRALIRRDLEGTPGAGEHLPVLEHILEQGCLARRMRRLVGPEPDADALASLCRTLADCLSSGRLLDTGPAHSA